MAARATWTDEEVAIVNDAVNFMRLSDLRAPGFERIEPLRERWFKAVMTFGLGSVEGSATVSLPTARRQLKRLAVRVHRTKVDWKATASAMQRYRTALGGRSR